MFSVPSANPFTRTTPLLQIQSALLDWYDSNHRILPWRRNAYSKLSSDAIQAAAASGALPAPADLPPNDFVYYVWVCEVMSQQTQVSRAADYFKRWIERWPSVAALAEASQEEVNEVWAGLGYYRRARFLLEGARYVQQNLDGKFPTLSTDLQKIPGVGPYTAAAISSIACGEKVAVVDGNVIRVLARLRAIPGDTRSSSAMKLFTNLSNIMIDEIRPGDFNQAVMELGATVCVPSRDPNCAVCPLSKWCRAKLAEDEIPSGPRVVDYPTKIEKAAKRLETACVSIIEVENHEGNKYLLVQRPKNYGLLAGLWEFPLTLVTNCADKDEMKAASSSYLFDKLCLGGEIKKRKELGEAVHIFSHIKMTLKVEKLTLANVETYDREATESAPAMKWVSFAELTSSGLSSGVRKVYQMLVDDMKTQKASIAKFFSN